MVDEQRVQQLLRRILDDISTLRTLGGAPEAPDAVRLGAIKYAFVTSIEGCARVAQHIGASEGWRSPSTNADALLILGEHDVIAPDLATRLACQPIG